MAISRVQMNKQISTPPRGTKNVKSSKINNNPCKKLYSRNNAGNVIKKKNGVRRSF